jgi:hypothetical protein
MGKAGSILPWVPAAFVAIVIGVVTSGGCAGHASPAARAATPAWPSTTAAPLTLELLDAVILPSDGTGGGRPTGFGSVSGLARDAVSGRYLAVIDDRNPSRVAWLDIAYDGRLRVEVGAVHPIRPGVGVDARLVTGADLEGVAALPDGRFVATEEGHRSVGLPGQPPPGFWPVSLLTLSPALEVIRVTPWPAMFSGADGIRDNQGAEALTRTPDGRLIAGLEQPLLGDKPAPLRNGRPFGGGDGGPGRLVEFVPEGDDWRAARQWLYPLAATPIRDGYTTICNDGELGLTALLALDDTRLLALERACLQHPDTGLVRNVIQLHEVDIVAADNIAALASPLDPRTIRPVSKRLVLDFDALIPRLPASLARLENFEALAFGPDLPDGSRTVLAVTDDNFRSTQRTVVAILRIGGRREEGGDRREAGYPLPYPLPPIPYPLSCSRRRAP